MLAQAEHLNYTENKYHVSYASDCLKLNGETISYGSQILDIDKLYIISTSPQSQLKTPIILDRNDAVDQLDRKIFTRNFIFEIVKAIEISSFEDATFIIRRVPKIIKYFVSIIQKISLVRWIQLLNDLSFYLSFYETLDNLISRREISKLRTDYVEQIFQAHLKTPYSRIFFLMDNLVLENQNLRNCITNLAKQIVLKEFQQNKFFEIYLFQHQIIVSEEDSENSGIQENKSEIDSIPEDKEMPFPEPFLKNAIQIIKSCQKIKIHKNTITNKILNTRFFKVLKHFFQTFFQKQRSQLLQILALTCQIEPIKMWKITFDQGRTIRCKSLLYLEALLTNSMMSYCEGSNKLSKAKKRVNEIMSKEIQKDNAGVVQSIRCWQLSYIIIQKLMLFQSPQRKTFLNRILNTLLTCKMIHEFLDCILLFLESSLKDDFYKTKNKQIWKIVVKNIENWLYNLMEIKSNKIFDGSKGKYKISSRNILNKTMMVLGSQNYQQTHDIICEQKETSSNIIPKIKRRKQQLKLPISKPNVITLMKIYKILIKNDKKFEIVLDPECLMYLIDLTEKRKGVIEGVRLALIDVLARGNSLLGENSEMSWDDEEEEGKSKFDF